MTDPKAWRAHVAHAFEANNKEVAGGIGITANEFKEKFVHDGKQARWQ